MIKLDGYKTEIEEIEVGCTVRVNHTDCSAGEDTRRRLYMTRPESDPAKIIAYCHNCSDSGVWGGTSYQSYRNLRHEDKAVPTVKDVIIEPKGLIEEIAEWTQDAQVWAYQNGLDQLDVEAYNISQDPTSGRVYLPRYDFFGATTGGLILKGYQLRKTDPQRIGPKYLTVTATDDFGYTVLQQGAVPEPHYCVIVEDLVSGIHIMNATYGDVEVIVNYGVKVNLAALEWAATYKRVIVWLDNDGEIISEKSDEMERVLKLISKGDISRCIVYSDPKHQTPETIRSVVYG